MVGCALRSILLPLAVLALLAACCVCQEAALEATDGAHEQGTGDLEDANVEGEELSTGGGNGAGEEVQESEVHRADGEQPQDDDASHEEDDSDVIPLGIRLLTSDSFCHWLDRGVEEAPRSRWLLYFYAPWCKHCQAADPAFTGVARKLAGAEHMYLGKVNVNEEKPLRKRFRVKEMPMIAVVEGGCNGTLYAYPNEMSRETSSLASFLSSSYRTFPSQPVPPPWVKRSDLSLVARAKRRVRKFLEATEEHRVVLGVLVGGSACAGVVVGFVLALLCRGTSKHSPAPLASKQAASTETKKTK